MDVGGAHLIIFVGVSDARNTFTCIYDPLLLAHKLMIAKILWTNTEVKYHFYNNRGCVPVHVGSLIVPLAF